MNTYRNLEILYAAGPADLVGSYELWKKGEDAPFEMSVSFSGLVFGWLRRVGARGAVVSWNSRKDRLADEPIVVENRPKHGWYGKRGAQFHLAEIVYGLWLAQRSLRERPDVLVVDSGTTYWITLAPVALRGIPVVSVIHSTLWPMGFPPRRLSHRVLRWLDGLFFRHFAAATICVSPECERQIRQLAGKPLGPVYPCRAQFQRGLLDRIAPPSPQVRPFRILFVGRIERNKGVLDIPAIAQQLEEEVPGGFAWKICGTGSASGELSDAIRDRGLDGIVQILGRVPRDQLVKEYEWAHAAIVPTTDQYSEGLAMTAAEAVLAGRPVVLSTVVPAWEVLGGAAIRLRPGDTEGFAAAFLRLATDGAYYEGCRRATIGAQAQFYDATLGLDAVLGRAIGQLPTVGLAITQRAGAASSEPEPQPMPDARPA